MKKPIFLLVLSICVMMLQANPTELLQQGNEAYKHADYNTAIESYLGVYEAGYESADLDYNLGNAYYRTDQYGLSILYYHRALRLRPHFPEAEQNLALANARTEDNITPLPEFLLARWFHSLVNLFSPTGWLIGILLLAVICVIFALLFRFAHSYSLRRGGLIALVVAGILFLVTMGCAISSIHRFNTHDSAVVTQPMVVVKSSPDESGVDKLILHDGTVISIEETIDSWHKIRLADGNTGWLPTADVTVI